MKKKQYTLVIVIILILLSLGIMFILINLSEKNALYNKLMSTLWFKNRDEFTSTKLVDFSGDPILHTTISVGESSIEFCNDEEVIVPENTQDSKQLEKTEDNVVREEAKCKSYGYFVDDNKITVIVDANTKVVYTFEFNSDGELILTYSGDGFEFKNYYSGAMG